MAFVISAHETLDVFLLVFLSEKLALLTIDYTPHSFFTSHVLFNLSVFLCLILFDC